MTYSQKRRITTAAWVVGYFVIGLITAAVMKRYGGDARGLDAFGVLGLCFFMWPAVWLFGVFIAFGAILFAVL